MSSKITYDNSSLRRFEYKQNGSYKFWEIIIGTFGPNKYILETRWGKIGNTPQINIKEFSTSWDRGNKFNTLVSSKIAKGYKEVKVNNSITTIKTPVLGKQPENEISLPKKEKELRESTYRVSLLEID